MRYEFHPEALAEYDAAAHYYAQQQAGLDLRFVASVVQHCPWSATAAVIDLRRHHSTSPVIGICGLGIQRRVLIG